MVPELKGAWGGQASRLLLDESRVTHAQENGSSTSQLTTTLRKINLVVGSSHSAVPPPSPGS